MTFREGAVNNDKQRRQGSSNRQADHHEGSEANRSIQRGFKWRHGQSHL